MGDHRSKPTIIIVHHCYNGYSTSLSSCGMGVGGQGVAVFFFFDKKGHQNLSFQKGVSHTYIHLY